MLTHSEVDFLQSSILSSYNPCPMPVSDVQSTCNVSMLLAQGNVCAVAAPPPNSAACLTSLGMCRHKPQGGVAGLASPAG